uniref:Homeodomain-only protein n=1 Tax=Kryptolebias marmoratus TaxID=37003 RepID=A0A3Q3ET18_KRYMA
MASGPQQNPKLNDSLVQILEENFKKNKFPDTTEVMLISAETGLTEETKWFQKRHEQWRQSEGLPAKVGSILD